MSVIERSFTIINFNQYENKLRIVIHNRHKMWSKDVAFNSKFITKKCLTLYLNLSWFKLHANSPKNPAIYSSRYLQSMKRQQSSCHLVLSTRLKTSSLNFPFSWLVFVIGFNNKLYNLFFFFHFYVFHVIFINIMVKNKELIFLAQGIHQYIIVAISLRWLVLVIGFNNNSINTVSFSIYLPLYEIFIKKWQKTRDCNFHHRVPIMEGCWTTSASSSFKFWRGSFGHRR